MSYEEFEIVFSKLIEDYVAEATPENIHRIILGWNFDNPKTVLMPIVMSKRTDKATALMLYWLMEPEFAKQFENIEAVQQKSAWYVEDYELIAQLEQNFQQNYYRSTGIGFDPLKDYFGKDRVAQFRFEKSKSAGVFPKIMFEPINGEPVAEERGWNEGIPPILAQQYDELLECIEE